MDQLSFASIVSASHVSFSCHPTPTLICRHLAAVWAALDPFIFLAIKSVSIFTIPLVSA